MLQSGAWPRRLMVASPPFHRRLQQHHVPRRQLQPPVHTPSHAFPLRIYFNILRRYKDLHISQGTYGHFQMMFAVIAPMLMTGAYAERLSFKAFLVFSAAWDFFVYVLVQPRAPARDCSVTQPVEPSHCFAAATTLLRTGCGVWTAGCTRWGRRTSQAALSFTLPPPSVGS